MLKEKIHNKISSIQKYNNFYFCDVNDKNLIDKLTILNKKYNNKIHMYTINNSLIENKFLREYSNYCTINYYNDYHEFVAFNEIGLYCGLHFFINECEIKFNEITQNNEFELYSLYKNIKVNNIYINFKLNNNLKIDNQNYMNFCKNFLDTKKFYIYLDESKILKKKNFFYFFNEINYNMIENIQYINVHTIIKINQKNISTEKDQETYNYYE